MPKTKFSNGIIQGKPMAKEYEGVLLLIATILRFTSGSRVLKDRKGYRGWYHRLDYTGRETSYVGSMAKK
jgi:hypothetical protein